jgi:hypothetical protein
MSEVKVDSFGDKRWYKDGKLHREDGPAIDHNDGYREWWVDGKLHRIDGPAIEYEDGDRYWYINGKLHRIDGPAIDHNDGHREWWVDGKLHRIDGPAIEYVNGDKEWCADGKQYNMEQFSEIVNFPEIEIPYISFSNSIYHIRFKEDVGIRLSYILELYVGGEFIKWDWNLGKVILGFVRSSEYIEPLLDWIQENGRYFPSEFVERLYY